MKGESIDGDIGGRLRRARKQRGLSLHDAAARTKLSMSVLQAIERNDFASLPRGIYRKGYLRSLAGEVGLDPNEIAAEYDKECEVVVDAAAVASSIVVVEDQWARQLTSPRPSVLTIVILLAFALGWFAWPDGVGQPLPDAIIADELVSTPPLIDTDAASPIRRAGVLAERTTTSLRNDVPLRIELAATDWCWVAAESDGKRVVYRLVEPGERLVLEGHRAISLRLGNAGSVILSINDAPGRLPGGDGEVVELKFTPDSVGALRAGAIETVSGD